MNSLFPHCRIFWHPFQQFIFRQTDPPFLRPSSPPAPFPPRRAHRSCGLASPPLPCAPLVQLGGAPLVVRPTCAPWCSPVAVRRDAWPPGLPARAAAPSARCAAWHPVPRCHIRLRYTRLIRAAIYPLALPVRRDGDIAPYRHYTHGSHTRYSNAPLARALRTRPLPERRRAASPVTARHPRPRRTPSKSPVAARHPADSRPLCSYTTRSNALCAPLC